MIIFATIVIVLIVFSLVLRNLQNSPYAERRRGYWRLGIAATALLLIGLIMTGRMHWMGAFLGLLLPLGKIIFHTLVERFIRKQIDPDAAQSPAATQLSLAEARAILGVEADANALAIETAYQNLLQAIDPDDDDNQALAARLMRARARLLADIDKKTAEDSTD